LGLSSKIDTVKKRTKERFRWIIYLLAISLWFLFSSFYISPLVEKLQSELVTPASTSILQVIGILIGFTGLSYFYFLGKVSDISNSLDSNAFESTQFLTKLKMKMQDVYRATKRNIVSLRMQESEIKQKETKEKFRELIDNCEKLERKVEDANNLDKLKKIAQDTSKDARDIINSTMRTLVVAMILQFSFYIISMVYCIIAIVSNEGNLLGSALSWMVNGIILNSGNVYDFQELTSILIELSNTIKNVRVTGLEIYQGLSNIVNDTRDLLDATLQLAKKFNSLQTEIEIKTKELERLRHELEKIE